MSAPPPVADRPKPTMDKEAFYEGLFDVQHELCKRYADEVGRLRKENAQLRKMIDGFPADMTEMQDRITLLETVLRSAGTETRSES